MASPEWAAKLLRESAPKALPERALKVLREWAHLQFDWRGWVAPREASLLRCGINHPPGPLIGYGVFSDRRIGGGARLTSRTRRSRWTRRRRDRLRTLWRASIAARFEREYMAASRALECRSTLGQNLLVDSVARMAASTLNFDRHRSSTSDGRNTIRGARKQPLVRLPNTPLPPSGYGIHRCGLR